MVRVTPDTLQKSWTGFRVSDSDCYRIAIGTDPTKPNTIWSRYNHTGVVTNNAFLLLV